MPAGAAVRKTSNRSLRHWCESPFRPGKGPGRSLVPAIDVDGGERSKQIPMPHIGPRGVPVTESRTKSTPAIAKRNGRVRPAGTSTAAVHVDSNVSFIKLSLNQSM